MRTPGDWCTKPLTNAGPTVMTADHARPMRDQDGKSWPTMEVVCECRSMDDARLIAAAPEMHDFLRWLREASADAALGTLWGDKMVSALDAILAKIDG